MEFDGYHDGGGHGGVERWHIAQPGDTMKDSGQSAMAEDAVKMGHMGRDAGAGPPSSLYPLKLETGRSPARAEWQGSLVAKIPSHSWIEGDSMTRREGQDPALGP